MIFRLFFLLSILLASLAPMTASAYEDKFYNIAHMTNTADAVTKAIAAGANALEIDLSFKTDGEPDQVYHGNPCDCTCSNPEICQYLFPVGILGSLINPDACNVASDAASLLGHIAQTPGVALVVVDSKMNPEAEFSAQGYKVISFLDKHLFDNGYRGSVIVGTAKLTSSEFIQSAMQKAASSDFKDLYTFSVDQEGDAILNPLYVMAIMTHMPDARAAGTGESVCSPNQYIDAISTAYANEFAGASGFTYAWTLDKELSMISYIQAGARGIITNRPSALAKIAKNLKLTLARPSDRIPRSKSVPRPISLGCDCDYSAGGCTISKAAPSGFACDCSYKGAWTCGGDAVLCSDKSEKQCVKPDRSKAACLLGGGDCGGYKN